MNLLHDIIAGEIRENGPMPFSRFMELCLYHPEHGYYEREDRVIGREGDFYTSVSVGPVFGEMLAWRFARWLKELEPPFQIVEAGAHDGRLALDVLDFLAQRSPELSETLTYVLLEPSPRRRARQRERLEEHGDRVRWIGDWAEMGEDGVNGIVFSNELLDAFPVDQLGWVAGRKVWHEWRVAEADGLFRRVVGPDAAPGGEAWERLTEERPGGFTVELRDGAFRWWRRAAKALRAGWLLTLDYGLETGEFFSLDRNGGTLRGYREHRLVDDALENVGEQDLTAHIDLGGLRTVGEAEGLLSAQTVSQGRWLTRLLAEMEQAPGSFLEWTPKRLRQFQTLTHPQHLGEKFRVLEQRRAG